MKRISYGVGVLGCWLVLAGIGAAHCRAEGAASAPAEAARGCVPQPANTFRIYGDDLDGLYNRQAEVCLGTVACTLDRYPPALPEPAERRLALLVLDGVFHEAGAPGRVPVQAFHHERIARAANEISKSRVKDGAQIWKLYNHAFVIRTASVTVAFDLTRGEVPGQKGFAVADTVIAQIVDQCDALFISHVHGDHADEWVAQAFLKQGKPVIAPPEVWADSAIHGRITHLQRKADFTQEVAVQGGRRKLSVVVYPGHQNETPNNVVLVTTPEELSFCHTGDQANDADFEWIDRVAEHHRVDVLMPNCWTPDIGRMAKGVKPRVIIPGHENELGHSVDHREAYWLDYDHVWDCPYPVLVMTWGESYHYSGEK